MFQEWFRVIECLRSFIFSFNFCSGFFILSVLVILSLLLCTVVSTYLGKLIQTRAIILLAESKAENNTEVVVA